MHAQVAGARHGVAALPRHPWALDPFNPDDPPVPDAHDDKPPIERMDAEQWLTLLEEVGYYPGPPRRGEKKEDRRRGLKEESWAWVEVLHRDAPISPTLRRRLAQLIRDTFPGRRGRPKDATRRDLKDEIELERTQICARSVRDGLARKRAWIKAGIEAKEVVAKRRKINVDTLKRYMRPSKAPDK